MADEIFYRTSGGGVTFSGGEPTLYPEYVGEIAGALRKNGVHVAIETAGTFDFDEFAGKLLPFVDLIYFDIKIIDNNKYRQCAGGDNRIPLENFRRLREYPGVTVVPSVPLVHGLTATGGNLAAIARFLRDTNGVAPVFRPYHPGAEAKRRLLGDAVIPRTAAPDAPLSAREERSAQRFFTRAVSPEPG
jgi:pyruvate formate lyase activating enzyme